MKRALIILIFSFAAIPAFASENVDIDLSGDSVSEANAVNMAGNSEKKWVCAIKLMDINLVSLKAGVGYIISDDLSVFLDAGAAFSFEHEKYFAALDTQFDYHFVSLGKVNILALIGADYLFYPDNFSIYPHLFVETEYNNYFIHIGIRACLLSDYVIREKNITGLPSVGIGYRF